MKKNTNVTTNNGAVTGAVDLGKLSVEYKNNLIIGKFMEETENETTGATLEEVIKFEIEEFIKENLRVCPICGGLSKHNAKESKWYCTIMGCNWEEAKEELEEEKSTIDMAKLFKK